MELHRLFLILIISYVLLLSLFFWGGGYLSQFALTSRQKDRELQT